MKDNFVPQLRTCVNRDVTTHMRKAFFLLGLLSFLLGCKTQIKSTDRNERYYPDPEIFQRLEKTSFIALDTVVNYDQLLDAMDRIACNEKSPILLFSDEKVNYNLLGFKECSQSTDVVDYFRSNTIRVENDSVFFDFDDELTIKDFKDVLKIIISEPLSYDLYDGDTLKPALIFFYADPHYSNEKIKKNLIKIITEFENLKIEEDVDFPFHFIFQRGKFPPPPPPFE